MNEFDEIRKVVAVKHSILLNNDDPSLVSATILNSILEQHVNTLNSQQEANLKVLINTLQQSQAETKQLAEKMINQGTKYTCDQITGAITASREEFKSEIVGVLKEFLKATHELKDEIVFAKKIALVAAGVSVICAGISVWALTV